ncbi:MAG: hypothetical protein ACK476_18320 [Fluviicola sp.]
MTNFKKIIFISITLILFSCNEVENVTENQDKQGSTDVFTKIYSVDNLKTQSFTIDIFKDNTITGKSGTKVKIDKNIFVDQNGKKIKGKVEIQLIEALTPIDMVLGNLTTTYNGKPLETGGMIYLNAEANGKEVSIASNKSISITMPTKETLEGMSVFEGKQDSTGIKWVNPIKLPEIEKQEEKIKADTIVKTTNIYYRVDGFAKGEEPSYVTDEVSRIAWAGDGLKISKDSVFKIDEYTVHFIKQKKLLTSKEVFKNEKGQNSFAEDTKTSYIFSIKKLGWANIDRLLEDPRTKEVELITSIENEKDFNFIYVTLITQNMYLPGYQKRDNTFSFSHDDEEKQELPVGETATILATAYKDNKPFFAIKKITITDKQTVSFKLEESTSQKMKAELMAKI